MPAGPKQIKTQADLDQDLAARHQADPRPPAPPETAADFAALQRDGYVIIENALDPDQLSQVRTAATALLSHTGRNTFEGTKTQRVYNVLAKTRAIDALTIHPRVLGLLDRLFLPNYLLSQLQIINILPGEDAQMLHPDDGFYKLPRPRPPLGVGTMWAIDEFTADNGATRIVPGSHQWGDQVPGEGEAVPATMPAGAVLFFTGTLWHGGGPNRTDHPRLAVHAQYCEPWLRQQENFMLEVPVEAARTLSPALQSLIGYSIHPPFMGMVDGKHPKRVLGDT